jgi:hypothetical protein
MQMLGTAFPKRIGETLQYILPRLFQGCPVHMNFKDVSLQDLSLDENYFGFSFLTQFLWKRSIQSSYIIMVE